MFADFSGEKGSVYKKDKLMVKKIMYGMLLSTTIATTLHAAEHCAAKKRIDAFGTLVQEVMQQRDAHRPQQVKLEDRTRKGPRVDGNPDQKKPNTEKK